MQVTQTPNSKVELLIADDDSDVVDSISAIFELERPNFTVRTATNANGLIKAVKETEPDLLLLDIKLGRDNGLEVLEKIKQDSPDITAVLMTAFRDADLAASAVRIGADDYLHKPLYAEQLLATIDRNVEIHTLKKATRVANERFRAIFDNSPQLLLLVNGDGKVIEVNDETRRFTRNNSDTALGRSLEDVKWREDIPAVSKRLSQLVASHKKGRSIRFELKLLRDDQKVRNIEFSVITLTNSDEKPELVLIEGRDVTERTEAEEFLRRANTILDQRVRERTSELEHARDLAESANRAKTEFLSKMNHELRTPLNAVLGFSQLISIDEDIPAEGREYADQILVAGKHLLHMVNEVLDLANTERGDILLSLESVEINGIIAECVQSISPVAEKESILIEFRCPQRQYAIGDRDRIRQVISHLLSNAIKYNRKNGKVEIVCETQGAFCRIKISDTGIGIHRGDIGYLFRPFTKLPHHQHTDGPGIGLTIAKRLVEAMDGKIYVESEFGVSSIFSVELPSAQAVE